MGYEGMKIKKNRGQCTRRVVNGTRRPTGGGIQIYFLHVDSNSFSHFFSGVRGLYIKSTFEKKEKKIGKKESNAYKVYP